METVNKNSILVTALYIVTHTRWSSCGASLSLSFLLHGHQEKSLSAKHDCKVSMQSQIKCTIKLKQGCVVGLVHILVPVVMPQCILKYHKMWNDRRFHCIIWYISSHGAVVGCCMTHGKALRIALQLNARITRCHCRGVHIPQVSHKWLSLNIKISKVFYQPPPDSAPLSTNDCVHLGNVDVFPFCRNHPGHWHHHSSCVSEAFSKADIWTTTRRHTVKSIHVCTMTQSSSLSIFFHPWSNSGSLCAFPSYPGLRVETRLWAI